MSPPRPADPPPDLAIEPPLDGNALKVLEARYLLRDAGGHTVETPRQLFWRVARGVAEAERTWGGDVEAAARELYPWLARLELLPNSPTLMNAGRPAVGQLAACFVLPVEDTIEAIFQTVGDAARIQRTGGGTGFGFSRLRPRGDVVRTTGGRASGPVSFLRVFNAATDAIHQGGVRRGANMGVLRVDHPDVLEFVDVKSDPRELGNFNLSVAVTDAFMQAVREDGEYDLINPRTGEPTGQLRAREVFERIARRACESGEPGLIFIDRINAANPTPDVGPMESTNPCVTGGTRLATQHGLVRIEDLALSGSGLVCTVDRRALGQGPGVTARRATPAVVTAEDAEVWRVTTDDGYCLEATAWHDLFTARGKLKVRDLRPGDELLVQSGPGQFGPEGSREQGRALARAVGREQAGGVATAVRVAVPELVWRGTEACVRGYLEGLFPDGASSLAGCEPGLLAEVQVLLANLGVFSSLRERPGQDPELMLQPEQRAFLSRVRAIEPIGCHRVFDLTQPDGNSVVFNGLVSGQCGELPLLPYESCNLGSIDVSKLIAPGGGDLDWERLGQAVRAGIRFLDDVIEANRYPLPAIEAITKRNRKVGLGVMGFADLLVALSVRYDSQAGLDLARRLSAFIRAEAVAASRRLAEERGPFPGFAGSVYAARGEPPRRHATVTTIAPTGTIALIAGCSSGIEPLFALAYVRRALDGAALLPVVHPALERVARARGFWSPGLAQAVARTGTLHGVDGVPADVREVFRTALEIAPEWHVRMQAAFQENVENACSKTINLPRDSTPEDVRRAYLLAYELGCKGITVYRDGSRADQVLAVPAPSGPPAPPIAPLELDGAGEGNGRAACGIEGCG